MKLLKKDPEPICVCANPTWWAPQQERVMHPMCPCCGQVFSDECKSHPHVTRFGDGTVPEATK